MLHARLEVAQILDMLEVRAVIHEFTPGTDPVTWEAQKFTMTMDDEDVNSDALTIILKAISLWSEKTISD